MSWPVALPTIEQGADWDELLDWHVRLRRYWRCEGLPDQPIDMVDSASMLQLRRTPQSYPVATLTPAAGIEFAAGGELLLDLTASHTAAIPAGDYLFDLKIRRPSGETERLLAGRVRFSAEISREL